jgi:predicted AlkP superfamily phosphohydrolase/phosphomutase
MKTDSLGNVDFGSSLLFPPTPLTMRNIGGLAVNRKDRERLGMVEPGEEFEQVIESAVETLRKVRVQETGEPFFVFVRKIQPTDMPQHVLRDRVDILLRCNFDAYHPGRHIEIGDTVCVIDEITEVRGLSGKHTNLGMFLISSPRFETGILLPALNTMSARVIRYRMRTSQGDRRRIFEAAALYFNLYEEVETLDVTPTLLTMFDLPVGRDMDGKILTRLMLRDVLEEHRLTYIDSYDDLEVVREAPEGTRSLEDEMEMLRALGYIK